MKEYLFIHPYDITTDFLSKVYENIPEEEKTVIRDCKISNSRLIRLIKSHDNVVMLGHGCADGLLCSSYSKDTTFDRLIINSRLVEFLRTRKKLIGIWCHASDFFKKYNLYGFATGMFVSDISEANDYGLPMSTYDVEENNNLLVESLYKCFDKDIAYIYDYMCERFDSLKSTNKIANFNRNLFYYNVKKFYDYNKTIISSEKEVTRLENELREAKKQLIINKVDFIYQQIKPYLSFEYVNEIVNSNNIQEVEKALNAILIGQANIRVLLRNITSIASDLDGLEEFYDYNIKVSEIEKYIIVYNFEYNGMKYSNNYYSICCIDIYTLKDYIEDIEWHYNKYCNKIVK